MSLRPSALLLLSALAGALAGGAAALFTAPAPAAAVTVAGPVGTDAVDGRVAALEDAVEAQGEALERLGRSLGARLDDLSRRPVVAQVAGPPEEPAAAAAVAAAGSDDEVLDAASLFERLLGAEGREADALWQRARELGLTDELLALFEARAEADPNDPELQVELGAAYLEKLQEAGQTAMAGMWATKADQAFDRALELNADHWDARMYKAVSLSFWPPIFGKQKEAVEQFELLIEKQQTLPPDPGHAQPYLLLGNLHWQRGDTEAAMAVWQQGSALFPDSAELSAKLGTDQ